MSNSASFWAAKSNGVKSPTAPAHVVTEPVAPRGPPKKAGTTNGVKKANWADSDDEDQFLASFTSSPRVQELEKTITAKDTRITDLAAALQEKADRIIELEAALGEQKQRLSELQGSADAAAARVAELEKENHKQFLHVQKLIAEVDEKDRRIAALETEVDERCATIAELEVGDSSTQVPSNDTSAATDKAATPDMTPPNGEVGEDDIEATKKTTQATTKQAATKAAPTKAAGPAVNLSGFPVFATPSTVKHTALPPPAPKLKMPIDLSKFAKKPVAKVAPKKKTEAAASDVTKDGPAPKIDPSSDIRTKRHEERVLFTNGPKVQVKMGDIALATVPKYVLMQCSQKAFKHFTDNPDTTSFTLPEGSMDSAAATAHLDWMKEMTYQGRVYSITLHSDEKFDDKNLQICRAARVLGLNNMYVGHFTKIFCDRIRSNTASYEFLSKVAALAYPENDPINDCLANNLANLRMRNAVKKPAELEALLEKYTGLKARVEKIEERMRKKQDSTQGTKGPKVVRVGKEMDL